MPTQQKDPEKFKLLYILTDEKSDALHCYDLTLS
jgi:hypothetical protein